MDQKYADNQYPILEILRKRWSPRAFSETPVEKEKLLSLFEAARWSPSAMNEQPWCFILGEKTDPTYQKIFDCLLESNQIWAKYAPVLLMSLGKINLSRSGKPNEYYRYDTGQSLAHLSIQAIEMGLYVHQMAGFDPDSARSLFKIPDNYIPLTVIAIGYPGDPSILPEQLYKRELSKRERREITEFIFSNKFGQISPIIK